MNFDRTRYARMQARLDGMDAAEKAVSAQMWEAHDVVGLDINDLFRNSDLADLGWSRHRPASAILEIDADTLKAARVDVGTVHRIIETQARIEELLRQKAALNDERLPLAALLTNCRKWIGSEIK